LAILGQIDLVDGRLVVALLGARDDQLKPGYLNRVVADSCGQGLSPKLQQKSNQLDTVDCRVGAVFLLCPTLELFGKTEKF